MNTLNLTNSDIKDNSFQVANLKPSLSKISPQVIENNYEEKTKTTLYYIFNKKKNLYCPFIKTTSTIRKTEEKARRPRIDRGRSRGKQRPSTKIRKQRSDKGIIRVVKTNQHFKTFKCYLKKYENVSLFEEKRDLVNSKNPNDISGSVDQLKKVKRFLMGDPSIGINTTKLMIQSF